VSVGVEVGVDVKVNDCDVVGDALGVGVNVNVDV
jgi:hypothetical protein